MKQWLGFFGVLVLLAAICALFMFVVPLESYSGAQCAGSAGTNGSSSDVSSCLCPGVNLVNLPTITKFDYHLLRGEMKAYQDAKPLVDACTGDKPIRLFL
jgi:hypothetical protein